MICTQAKTGASWKKMLGYGTFLLATLFFQEMVLRVYTGGALLSAGMAYTFLLTVPIAFFCALLTSLWSPRANRVVAKIILCLITLLFLIQLVYFTVFSTFFTLYSFTGTGKILQFWAEIFHGIARAWLPILLVLIPVVLLFVFAKKLVPAKRPGWLLVVSWAVAAIAVQLTVVGFILCSTSGVMSVSYLYRDTFILKLSMDRFGLLTTTRLDAENLFSHHETADGETEDETKTTEPGAVVYDANVMEIDFDALSAAASSDILKDMDSYVSSVKPTSQNQYTGMFEGKNLIWIVAEGFSSWALNESKTPTLYQLAHEGFVFKNYYNPIWNVSTSDGEYTATTGLLPKPGVWSYFKSGSNYMPFAMGNQLSALGYSCRAYHDHSYDYYRRDVSHPNMGYEYKGVGNGLDITVQWPESDIEMMEVTIPEYIDDDPFVTYYMTVSGHLEYNFDGNMMARKHMEEVDDLDNSTACRAYIACNMEFDQAMKYLLEQLEAAGKLDDTLIAISGDHYPYGLTINQINELNGSPVDKTFDLYHSTFILWSSTMKEPVVVDKVCDAIDILPTLSNLLGLEYDSRLFSGRDIFADEEGLAVFENHSWVSDSGRYDASQDEFVPNEGVTVAEDYAVTTMNQVNDMFTAATRVLENDYYAHVFPDGKPVSSVSASSNEFHRGLSSFVRPKP